MKLRPTQILVLAAGALVFIAAFFNFVKVDAADLGIPEGMSTETVCEQAPSDVCDLYKDEGFSAWNTDFYAPLSLWPALLGLVVAAAAALQIFGNKALPNVLGFSSSQLLFALAAPGALIMIGWLIQGTEAGDWGVGFWIMLVASVALAVGAAIEMVQGDDAAAGVGPAQSAPTPF